MDAVHLTLAPGPVRTEGAGNAEGIALSMLIASTRKSTPSVPGTGSGTSSYRKTSGLPGW